MYHFKKKIEVINFLSYEALRSFNVNHKSMVDCAIHTKNSVRCWQQLAFYFCSKKNWHVQTDLKLPSHWTYHQKFLSWVRTEFDLNAVANVSPGSKYIFPYNSIYFNSISYIAQKWQSLYRTPTFHAWTVTYIVIQSFQT